MQIAVRNISHGKFSGLHSDFHFHIHFHFHIQFHFHFQDADRSSQHFPWKVLWLALGLSLSHSLSLSHPISLSLSGCRSQFATFPLESSLARAQTFTFTST